MTRVLIVDDYPENLYLLRSLLGGHGFTVLEAGNGAEALVEARRAPPDLIISDLLMPVLDGYSMLRQWRADAALKAIPFIVFTATYTAPRDRRLAMALGADAFLIKPAEPEVILGCVQDVRAQQAAGQLPSMRRLPVEDRELVQDYNEILLQKIEKKALELEWANQTLRREVAERQRAQDDAREAASRFRATFEQVQVGIAHLALDGRMVWSNRKLAEMCGYTLDEMPSLTFRAITHPDWRDDTEAAGRAMLAGQQQSYTTEKLYLRKDGSSFWGNLVATLVCDEEGQPAYFISVIQDVSDRKRMEEVLLRRDRAIQAVSQGITITDPSQPDNPITYASQGFVRMTGYSEAEVLGWNCRFLQGEHTDRAQVQVLREAIAAGQPATVELLNYRKDGTSFWNEVSVSPVLDDNGKLAYFVGTQSDVTARKQLESDLLQMQKMEAVGQLAGGIAHDFNNHLTVINGYSDELLALPGLTPAIREAVTAIAEAGDRAAGLTRQLLGFSRQTMLQPRRIDLNLAIAQMGKLLRRLIGSHVELGLSLAPGLHPVLVDPTQLDQVLINLVVNARDAMPQGGRLTITTANVSLSPENLPTQLDCRPGCYAMIVVADTGTGMTPEVRAKLFEPFFTTKGVGKGTGLGLPTVLGIVQQSRGCIDVESEPGQGTRFKVYLPAAGMAEAGEAPDEAISNAGLPPEAVGEGVILLVEDDDDIRRLAQLALSRQGYKVILARDGTDALAQMEATPARLDLVLTDVVMPNMGGIELVQRLRARFPYLRALFMSGYTDDTVLRHGLLEARVAFIQKPYTRRSLIAKVREVLEGEPPDA